MKPKQQAHGSFMYLAAKNMEGPSIEIPQSPPDGESVINSPHISEPDHEQAKEMTIQPPSMDTLEGLHFKNIVEIVAESAPVTIIMSLFTIWALFGDDIRLSSTTKESDEGFLIVISIAFFLFLLEILASSYYKEGYLNLPNLTYVKGQSITSLLGNLCNFGSFYFWLDVIATLSLIFEVSTQQNGIECARH